MFLTPPWTLSTFFPVSRMNQSSLKLSLDCFLMLNTLWTLGKLIARNRCCHCCWRSETRPLFPHKELNVGKSNHTQSQSPEVIARNGIRFRERANLFVCSRTDTQLLFPHTLPPPHHKFFRVPGPEKWASAHHTNNTSHELHIEVGET